MCQGILLSIGHHRHNIFLLPSAKDGANSQSRPFKHDHVAHHTGLLLFPDLPVIVWILMMLYRLSLQDFSNGRAWFSRQDRFLMRHIFWSGWYFLHWSHNWYGLCDEMILNGSLTPRNTGHFSGAGLSALQQHANIGLGFCRWLLLSYIHISLWTVAIFNFLWTWYLKYPCNKNNAASLKANWRRIGYERQEMRHLGEYFGKDEFYQLKFRDQLLC